MRITSNALWSKDNIPLEDSICYHDDIKVAEMTCKFLKSFTKDKCCQVRGICIDAWVEVDGVRQ